MKHIIGPELEPLTGNGASQSNAAQAQHVSLVKQLLEFPPRPRFEPHTHYRNVLFVRPLALSLSSVKSPGGSSLSLSTSAHRRRRCSCLSQRPAASAASSSRRRPPTSARATRRLRAAPSASTRGFSRRALGGESSVRLASLASYKNIGVSVQLVQVEQSHDAQNWATLKYTLRPLKSVFSPGPSEWVDVACTSIVYRCRFVTQVLVNYS